MGSKVSAGDIVKVKKSGASGVIVSWKAWPMNGQTVTMCEVNYLDREWENGIYKLEELEIEFSSRGATATEIHDQMMERMF